LLRPESYDTPISRSAADLVKQIAGKFQHETPKFHNGDKLRVGYLTEGFDKWQAPVRRLMHLSKYHNEDGVDITVFSRLSAEDKLVHWDCYQEVQDQLRQNGCDVVAAPSWMGPLDRSLWLFDIIRSKKIDVLVTYAMATIPHLHFLCAMKPAPILVKDCLQQAEFSDLPDATIHHSHQTMKDDVGLCRYLPFRGPKPERKKKYARYEFGIPKDAVVLATVGRPGKYNQTMFPDAITAMVNSRDDVWFLGIGSLLKTNGRQIHTGLVDNPYDMLCDIADIYIDSFPLGGGWTLIEAMQAGLPIVMFDKGEIHKTSETTLPEIWGESDTIIPRWDIDKWQQTINRLIDDTKFKNMMILSSMQKTMFVSDYESYVSERERLYAELYVSKRCTRKYLNGTGKLEIDLPIYADNKPETIYIDNSADIRIGSGLSISQEVTILRHEHFHDKGLPIGRAKAINYPLEIGKDVQIGARAMILPGCRNIGNGAVIGAGSIVTKDIPNNEIWAGNPARKINERV